MDARPNSPTPASPKSRGSRRRTSRPPGPEAQGTLRQLQRALDVLRVEAPHRYSAIAAILCRAPARYQVGSERFTVTAAHGRITPAAGWRTLGTQVEISVPPQAIVDLVDGITTFERLIAMDVLRISAETRALLALDESTRLLIRAGIASAALQAEFDTFRMWVLRQRKEDGRAKAR